MTLTFNKCLSNDIKLQYMVELYTWYRKVSQVLQYHFNAACEYYLSNTSYDIVNYKIR